MEPLDRLLSTNVDPTNNIGDCWQSGSTSLPNINWFDLQIAIGASQSAEPEMYSMHQQRICQGTKRSNYLLRLVTEMKSSHANGTITIDISSILPPNINAQTLKQIFDYFYDKLSHDTMENQVDQFHCQSVGN